MLACKHRWGEHKLDASRRCRSLQLCAGRYWTNPFQICLDLLAKGAGVSRSLLPDAGQIHFRMRPNLVVNLGKLLVSTSVGLAILTDPFRICRLFIGKWGANPFGIRQLYVGKFWANPFQIRPNLLANLGKLLASFLVGVRHSNDGRSQTSTSALCW